VILYRVAPISYRIGHRLLHVSTYGMVNLLAGERIVPELIQDDCTPERVAAEAIGFLTDAPHRSRTEAAVRAMKTSLGQPGATARAARIIVETARGHAAPVATA
jgi:lipid-A-disaccharide synthase